MDNEKAHILWGVCGIGHGHTFRQLPLIQHFADEGHKIMIFAYNNSFDVLSKQFQKMSNVEIEAVAVPYYVGTRTGLDFNATAQHPANQNVDFQGINARAMTHAASFIGKPDLVISDYEPVSAQYAYAQNAPLVTLDQQSKYLNADIPDELHGQSYIDEVERLRMFFPKATKRLACSFFDVAQKKTSSDKVTICPPILRSEIVNMQRHKTDTPSILIYLSAQMPQAQSIEDITKICTLFTNVHFHLFTHQAHNQIHSDNITLYPHGTHAFQDVMRSCHGIISTAGHSLLSEAMALAIPVYALPLPLYEQQMNAHIIHTGGFGMSSDTLTATSLAKFLDNLTIFEQAIRDDRTTLLKSSGQPEILHHLKATILKK